VSPYNSTSFPLRLILSVSLLIFNTKERKKPNSNRKMSNNEEHVEEISTTNGDSFENVKQRLKDRSKVTFKSLFFFLVLVILIVLTLSAYFVFGVESGSNERDPV
jgi:hypothetical protein